MNERLNTFLSMIPADWLNNDFRTQYSIVFYDKITKTNVPNNVLHIDVSTRTVRDMQIEDKELFRSIVNAFSTEDLVDQDISRVRLKDVCIHEFMHRIVDPDKYQVIGRMEQTHMHGGSTLCPGTQMTRYVIN